MQLTVMLGLCLGENLLSICRSSEIVFSSIWKVWKYEKIVLKWSLIVAVKIDGYRVRVIVY